MQRKVVNVTENPEQGARFEALIDALDLTQTSIAQVLGISQSYVSQMVGGSRNISRRVLHFITNAYPKVNVHWLLTGQGEMFFDGKIDNAPPEPGIMTGVMEPSALYERVGSLRVEDLPGIILSLQAEVAELRDRVRRLDEGMDGESKV